MRLINEAREVVVCAGLVLAIGMTLTVFAYQMIRQANDHELAQALNKIADQNQQSVRERMSDYQFSLRGVRGAVTVAGAESFDHQLFVRYLQGQGVDNDFEGAHGFGFIRRVAQDQVEHFLSSIRERVEPEFRLQEFEAHSGDRYIVLYVEPELENREVLGLDIASESRRREAAQAAMRTGQTQLTAPIELRLDGAASPAMLLLMPIYGGTSIPEDVASRERTLLGWSFTALVVAEALHQVQIAPHTCLKISDITDAPDAGTFFSGGQGCAAVPVVSRQEVHWVYGRQWRFETSAGSVFAQSLHLQSPTWIFVLGSLGALFLSGAGAALVVSANRRSRLLSDQSRLAAIVESSTDGIISKNLDGVVTSWNRGAQNIFGYTAQEAVGKRLYELIIPMQRHSEEHEILGKIRLGIPITNFDTVRHRKDGSFVDVSVNVSPLLDAKGEIIGASKTVRDISLQKQAEARILELNAGLEGQIAERTEQLRTSNLMLSSVLRSATEVAIIATRCDGVIEIFNAGAQRMLGYSQEELVGKATPKIFHVAQELAQRAQQDQEAAGANKEFDTLVSQCRTDGSSTREWTFVRKDGSRFPVTLMVTEIRDDADQLTGYLGIAVDITRREAVQGELTAARDQLLMAADVAQLGIWSWEVGSSHMQWNDRMFDFYFQSKELSASGVRHSHWIERVHPDDRASAQQRLEAILRGEQVDDQTFRVLSPEGLIRVIQSGAHVERDGMGRPLRVTGINLDITSQRELQARLLEAKERSDAASDAKSTFLANMSHEIRTPLNAVLGMLQLLEQAGLNSRQAGYVGNARVAARSLLSLLNDILDYSKIEAHKLQLDIHPFNLDQLLRDLAIILAGNQTTDSVEVLFELDPALPVHLLGDSLRLQQVLINLAGNALKFTSEGQVVVRLKCLESGPRTRVRIEVEDSGIGIAPEHLEHIFEGFSQAQASTTRHYGGTGLGLAICKRLVEMMGGTLSVRSELGVGSCFWFDADLQQGDTPAAHDSTVRPERLSVLVVDDNPVARHILAQMINGLGWRAETVASGAEALQRIDECSGKCPFDVVLMDWDMPQMDGLTTARHLTAGADGMGGPVVIMVTAHSREVLTNLQGSDPSVRGLLSKPVTPIQLVETIAASIRPQDPSASVLHPAASSQGALAGLRLLVVEDNALNRQVALELLEQVGAQVELADGGDSGLQRLSQTPAAFDAVLMDIQMPGIDGYEATRRIRNDLHLTDLPIIAMTANAGDDDRKASLAAGMTAHLAKPINLPHVIATVLRCCGRAVLTRSSVSGDQSGDMETLASILSRLGENKLLFGRLAEQFGAQMSACLVQLRQAVQANDDGLARRLLHTIKGLAGNLGARLLSQVAGEQERRLQSQEARVLSERLTEQSLAEIEQVATRSTEQLMHMLEDISVPVERERLSEVEFDGQLSVILPLLEDNNLRGLTLLEAMGEYCLPCSDLLWTQLNEPLRNMDFKAACLVLRHIMAERNRRAY